MTFDISSVAFQGIYLLHPRLRSPFITASTDSQPGMRLIKPLRVQTRFHTLSYGRVRSVKLAGRSFPWNSHLRGRKVNFASRPTSFQQSCSRDRCRRHRRRRRNRGCDPFSGERLAKNARRQLPQ